MSNVKYVDAITGEVYEKEPVPLDYEFPTYAIVRVVPDTKLIEVAIEVPYSIFEEIANMTAEWAGVERPADRIVLRFYKAKVNVFLDAVPDDGDLDDG